MSSHAVGIHSLYDAGLFLQRVLLLIVYFILFYFLSELSLLKKEGQLPQGLDLPNRAAYEEKGVKCVFFIIFKLGQNELGENKRD